MLLFAFQAQRNVQRCGFEIIYQDIILHLRESLTSSKPSTIYKSTKLLS